MRRKARRLLQDESGRLIHWTVVLAIVAITTTGVTPPIMHLLSPGPAQKRSARCIANILKIKRGADPKSMVCPVVKKPYRIERRNGLDVLVCPDPKNHLNFALRLIREDGGWKLEHDLPKLRVQAKGRLEMTGSTPETVIDFRQKMIVLHLRERTLLRVVKLIVGGGLGLILVGVGVGALLELYRFLKLWKNGKDDEVRVPIALAIIAAATLAAGSFFVEINLHAAIRSEEVTIDWNRKDVIFQPLLFEKAFADPRMWTGLEGIFPAFGKGTYQAVVYYTKKGKLAHRKLFTKEDSNLSPVSLLNIRSLK